MNLLTKLDPSFLKQFWPQFWAGLAVLVVVGIGGFVLRLLLKRNKFVVTSKDELKEILGEKVKQINYNKGMGDIYKISSQYQSGGFTGVANINQPRKLDQKLKDQLVEVISDKNSEIRITAALGDGEAIQFATEIKEYFESAGYKVKGVDQAIYKNAPKGQTINKKGGNSFEIIIGHKQ